MSDNTPKRKNSTEDNYRNDNSLPRRRSSSSRNRSRNSKKQKNSKFSEGLESVKNFIRSNILHENTDLNVDQSRRNSSQRGSKTGNVNYNAPYEDNNYSRHRNKSNSGSYGKSFNKKKNTPAIVNMALDLWYYRKREILAILGFVAVLIVFVNVIQFFVGNNAYEININGKPIGIVKSQDMTIEDYEKNLITLTENKLISDAGANVQILDKITVTSIRSSSNDMSTEESILSILAQSLNYKVSAVQIVVDGTVKTTVDSMLTADDITNKIISQYMPSDDVNVVSTGFVEDVNKEVIYVYQNEIHSYEKAYDILTDTHLVDGTYTVVPSDNASSIATRNGISRSQFYEMNPGMDDNYILKIGEVVNLHAEQPLLSVKIIQEITYTETVKKTTQNIENAEERTGYSRVVQQGRDGEQIVTAHVTRINGFEVGQPEVVSTNVTTESTAEIIEIGTK